MDIISVVSTLEQMELQGETVPTSSPPLKKVSIKPPPVRDALGEIKLVSPVKDDEDGKNASSKSQPLRQGILRRGDLEGDHCRQGFR